MGAQLLGPTVAHAAESQYAYAKLRTENQYAASSVVGSHTGGRGFVAGNAYYLDIHLETRSATNYAVLASQNGAYGGPITMTHTRLASTWSLCKWNMNDGKTTSGQLAVSCWRTY